MPDSSPPTAACEGLRRRLALSRRDALRMGGLCGLGLSLPTLFAQQAPAKGGGAAFGRAKRVIMLYLHGGHPRSNSRVPASGQTASAELPTWFEAARLEYTLTLAKIQDAILPAGLEGSISTLPIAWGTPAPSAEQLSKAASHLRLAAAGLAKIKPESGRLIYLCIEPEPGCVLDTCDDLL